MDAIKAPSPKAVAISFAHFECVVGGGGAWQRLAETASSPAPSPKSVTRHVSALKERLHHSFQHGVDGALIRSTSPRASPASPQFVRLPSPSSPYVPLLPSAAYSLFLSLFLSLLP